VVHIEGMGVLGSTLAHALDEVGVSFTWNDTEQPYSAWQASTGSVYPTGNQADMTDLLRWNRWARGWAARYTERVPFWYLSKVPPNGASYKPDREVAGLRRAPMNAIVVNVQLMVEGTRHEFAARRTLDAPSHGLKIVAHGYDSRYLSHVLWGWTVPVELNIDRRFGLRPLLYLRKGRYGLAYAYPRPGTSRYYSGSSIISQNTPHELAVMPKFERWRSDVLERTRGLVSVGAIGEPLQGWRPAPRRPYEQHSCFVNKIGQDLVATPLMASGVRRSPSFVAEVLEHLGVEPGCAGL
jgi:hypothetical protein